MVSPAGWPAQRLSTTRRRWLASCLTGASTPRTSPSLASPATGDSPASNTSGSPVPTAAYGIAPIQPRSICTWLTI